MTQQLPPPMMTPYGMNAVPHPHGVAVLVTGILSLTVVPFLGPVAWWLGASALREIDAAPGHYTNRGTVMAGMVCGIIGTVLFVLGVVFLVTIILWVTTGDGIKGTYEEEAAALIGMFAALR